jgi:type II secretory pathway pseudopilin PulG
MLQNLPKYKNKSGQTLISLLIALAIFAILSHAIFTLTTSSFKTVSFSKARIAARHIAEEKIETIRNMPYDSIGTVGGIPYGTILQKEDRLLNGLNFVIKTSIVYVDDPFDQQAPNDILPTDYKRVRIDVSWGGAAASTNNPVVITTDIAPKGIEKIAGGGTLSILVFDANADPIPQAEVHIFSNSVTPNIDITQNTNTNGRMVIPGIPHCTECYNIAVTKSGYSIDKTFTTSEIANPAKPLVSVNEGSLTEISFIIDKNSTLNISTLSDRENLFIPIPNIPFVLTGQKTIGTDIGDYPVYKFEKQFTTNTLGSLTITDLEWDNYTITFPGTTYNIATSNPLNPYTVLPNTNTNWLISLVPYSANNLHLIFVNDADFQIASVSASLIDSDGVEQVKVTGESVDADFGQAFFQNLSNSNYSIEATSSAYLKLTKDITITGVTKDKNILVTPTPTP